MSLETESVRFAGDIVIRRLDVVSSANFKVNMTNQVVGIEIYEDLFSPFISMSITIRESQDFINALPLRGEEIINLEISTPGFTKEELFFKGKYYIYKISDRLLLTDRNAAYTLHCISYEALIDLNMKQSKAFRGNIGDVAKEILGKDGLNTTKKYAIEPTKNAIKYISNFWSPAKNLNFLASSAQNNEGHASYLFYENREGFNFKSLDTLYKQDVLQKFIKDNHTRDTNGNTSNRNVNKDYQQILEMKVREPYDALKFTQSGAYASRMFAYDLVKKKYFAKDYDALTEFDKSPHLNKKALYTTSKPVTAAHMIFNEMRHYSAHNGFPDTSSVTTMQQRNSKLNLFRSAVIEIDVFGRTDYTVGKKVYVEVPKPAVIASKDQPSGDNGFIDKTYSGNYIISAINHIISRDKHTCILELSKESKME